MIAATAQTEAELLASETAKYVHVWQKPEYRVVNHGLDMWRHHREAILGAGQMTEADLLNTRCLDLGCGNGRLVQGWLNDGLDAYGVDFASNAVDVELSGIAERFSNQCLWSMKFSKPFGLAICADVMEHIPPERIDAALRSIAKCCDFVVFKIANYPSVFLNLYLHLSLNSAQWWLDTLGEFGQAKQLPIAREGIEEYIFAFTPNRRLKG